MNDELGMIKTQPLTLYFQPVINLSDDQLYEFCQINRELQIERTAEGNLIIMAPTGGETIWRNSELIIALGTWAKQDQTGIVFDSSGGFILPNGAMRVPDVAWVKRTRLAVLTQEQKKRFIPLCPDFVIELRSPSDHLSDLQAKMEEYIDNGALAGWLIDPENRGVYLYRPDGQVKFLENPTTISGDPVLPGFVCDLNKTWIPDF